MVFNISQLKMLNLVVVKCTPLFRQFTYEIVYLCALYKFIEELPGITDAECRKMQNRHAY